VNEKQLPKRRSVIPNKEADRSTIAQKLLESQQTEMYFVWKLDKRILTTPMAKGKDLYAELIKGGLWPTGN
jgi:hypothetical protein